jgi:hypothetical protein
MSEKTGRNDSCPCGSGKKYKQCCLKVPAGKKRKFSATVLSQPKKAVDLMERTYGRAISRINEGEAQTTPSNQEESLGLEPPRM